MEAEKPGAKWRRDEEKHMKIYVAGASKELDRARRVMARLRESGHEITEDWTVPVAEKGAMPATKDARMAAADADIAGVYLADLFILLHPAPGVSTTGAWFELGLWYGLREGFTIVSYETEESRGAGPACLFVDEGFVDETCLDDEILRVLSEMDFDEDEDEDEDE